MSNLIKNLSGNWVFINGEVYIINYNVSVFDLFSFLQKTNPGLIIEYNQKILSKNVAEKVFLKHFDSIEFVTIVGGG